MIYLIADENLTMCKIGTSRDVKKRLAMIQTGCPLTLHLHSQRDGDHRNERSIHQALAQWKIRGEWFHLNDEVLSIFRNHDGYVYPTGEGYGAKSEVAQVLRQMMAECDPYNCDYDGWVENIFYVLRHAVEEFADEADAALDTYDPDEFPFPKEQRSMIAWKAIVDMIVWGHWDDPVSKHLRENK